ncbi:MAG: acyl-CoA dehydrogenase family protein [Pseudomonadales bacterium]|jgi:acyl-CoA dehydrogenase|nr:acyl-CoA dehydrogenase family protein [Pseudomonadales bacterium]MDP6473230.1 acyl-CoA dehydrogenase family protein [Pseudomonadales bacterium]MDP6826009.1 acyl-CoA dehydrogenase family protein [Pseudomonadales bacterium]MDP6971655.1 acyl-CoA dehydrogenase family protein [Pseudomonadales bacterium]|tara:strand:+ start:1807 stop:3042 length:1236 start_codon:yes stop_codon:yes gene_type:complete
MSAIAIDLPEKVTSARDGILAFAEQEVLPRHEANQALFENPRSLYREDGRFSDDLLALIREVRTASAAAGFYQMCVPEKLGGGGLGHLAYFVAWNALFHRCGPQNWLMLYALAHWAFGPSRLLTQVTPEAQQRILAGLMDGTRSMCFGLSEPNAGSDASMIKTRARKDGDGWRISGRKIWTSNAPIANYCVVFAVTDADRAAAKQGGISAFLVPTDSPGFTVQRIIKLFGHIGGDEAELALEDVYVEPWQIVGELDQGFSAALYGVSLGRIYNSARAVGYGRWAVELALEYASTREAFGSTISQYQGVTFPLADSATELHAAHLMGINAAMLLDQGNPAVKELSMTKAYSVQAGYRAVDRAIQTHGAMGFTNEVGLTQAWHSLRIVNVADGTNEILNRTIAQRLLKGDTDI